MRLVVVRIRWLKCGRCEVMEDCKMLFCCTSAFVYALNDQRTPPAESVVKRDLLEVVSMLIDSA